VIIFSVLLLLLIMFTFPRESVYYVLWLLASVDRVRYRPIPKLLTAFLLVPNVRLCLYGNQQCSSGYHTDMYAYVGSAE